MYFTKPMASLKQNDMNTNALVRTSLVFILGYSLSVHGQNNVLNICKIGFHSDTLQIADTSAETIRNNYQELYMASVIRIVANMSNEDSVLLRAQMEEVRELLWEGGIPPASIRLIDASRNDSLQVLHLRNNTCYLIFHSRNRLYNGKSGGNTRSRSTRDTVIACGDYCYLHYSHFDYAAKTSLPEIQKIGHDQRTKEELGLYEKVNTRGSTAELAQFKITKNDSDYIDDHIIMPLHERSFKTFMRLERFSSDKSAWLPVEDPDIRKTSIHGKSCVRFRIRTSGVYRLLGDPGNRSKVLYFRAPSRMAFVKAVLKQDALTQYEGVFTDRGTGVVFLIPHSESGMTGQFILKDGSGNVHHLPESDWKSLVDREVKVRDRKSKKVHIGNRGVNLPEYAFLLDKDLNEVRTMNIEIIK